jgi:arylsulfatase A-like enzyme
MKKNYNNTILIITGDHGAREVQIFNEGEQVDFRDNQSALYDGTCNHKPFSNDQLFNTGGMISYLGDDPEMKELFSKTAGKVIKVPTDHQDLIRTLYDIVESRTGVKIPSSRNGRNLLELAQNLTEGKPLRNHIALHATQIHSEVTTESEIYRYHSLGF